MSIPKLIEELAHKVRTEIYGRDVREALATSMEATAEVAEWSREVAQQILDGSFDEGALNTEIERKLNELEQQYAPNLSNLENEIESARGDSDSLSERFNDIDSQIAKTEKNATSNRMQPVETPELFGWQDHPLRNKIFTDGYGNFHIKGFTIEKYKPRGTVMYVDVKNGDDNNDGLTLETAKQTIPGAYNSGAVVIKIAEGIYNREQTFFGLTLSRSIAIEAIPGHDVYLTQSWHANWQEYNAPVYVANTSNVAFILDPSTLNEYGNWSKYKKVNTLEEVNSTPGSYAIIGSQTFIHTFSGEAPNLKNVVRFTNSEGLRFEANGTLFLKGLNIFGGNSALYTSNTSSNDSMQVFAKDCEFKFSNDETHNVVWVRGAELAIFEKCKVTDGYKDGFNYAHGNGVRTNVIEINCIGIRNGTEGHGDDQGSTQHNGGKIIRIGGLYHSNNGSNIADEGEETQSWNLGCICYNSKSGTTTQRSNFFAYPGVDMWLDSCVGFDVGEGGYDIGGTGNVYIRNVNLLSDNKIANTVNLAEY